MDKFRNILNRTFSLFLAFCSATTSFHSQASIDDNSAMSVLNRVVEDVCEKKLVFLGESSNHGERKVWQTKAILLDMLIETCGFDVVLVESGIYDFIDLEEQIENGTASEKMLKNSVGRVWSKAESSKRWISFLYEKAKNKQIVIGGIDDQLHSTAEYVKAKLPKQLAGFLTGNKKVKCESAISNYANWRYTQLAPFNIAERDNIVNCLSEMEKSIQASSNAQAVNYLSMTRSLKRYFTRQLTRDRSYNLRDLSMYENFQAYQKKLPQNSKFIIWSATIHGSKDLSHRVSGKQIKVLGHYLNSQFGDDFATIGFSAFSGEYSTIGQRGKIQVLSEAPDDSIEASAISGHKELSYLNKKQITKFGNSKARALNNQFEIADWSKIVDGLIVIRKEEAPIFDVD